LKYLIKFINGINRVLFKSLFRSFLAALALFVVFFGLTACTSESKAKKEALKQAQWDYEIHLKEEVNNKIDSKHPLLNDYLMFLSKRTEYEVENVIKNDSQFLIVVSVRTVRDSLRFDLENVIQKLSPHQYSKFNFGDALDMIKTQRGGEIHQEFKMKIPVRVE